MFISWIGKRYSYKAELYMWTFIMLNASLNWKFEAIYGNPLTDPIGLYNVSSWIMAGFGMWYLLKAMLIPYWSNARCIKFIKEMMKQNEHQSQPNS